MTTLLIWLSWFDSLQSIPEWFIWNTTCIWASIELRLLIDLLNTWHFLRTNFLTNGSCFSSIFTLTEIIWILLLICKFILESILKSSTWCIEQVVCTRSRSSCISHSVCKSIWSWHCFSACQSTTLIINLSPFVR